MLSISKSELKNNKAILFLSVFLSIAINILFLTRWSIWLLWGVSVTRFYLILIAVIINLFIILLSTIEAKLTKGRYLIILNRKEIYLAIFSLLCFFVAKLALLNKINIIIGFFLNIFFVALFLAIIFSFFSFYFKKADLYLTTKKLPHYILSGLIIAFIVFYTWLVFLKFKAGLMGMFDLGNMVQAVWSTLHGYLLRNTGTLEVINLSYPTRLGFHADLFLIFLVPFYALWQSPKLLLLVQVIIAGTGAFPLYLIAKKLLKSPLAGLVFAFAYLVSPILGAALLYDFHAITLVSSFLFFAFYFLLEKRYLPYFIFILLALTCKEEVSLLIFLLGIYVYLKHNKKIGIITILLGLIWFITIFFIIMPHFRNGGEYVFLGRYAYLGRDKITIIKNLITRPGLIIYGFKNINKLVYLLYLILPLAGLCLFSPFIILGAPTLFINLLSTEQTMYSGGFHYSAPLLFYLLLSTIFGFIFLIKIFKNYPLILYKLLLILFLSGLIFGLQFRFKAYGIKLENFNSPPPSIKDLYTQSLSLRLKNREKIISLIPKNSPVSTSVTIGSFFADRENLYIFPLINNSEFIVLEKPGTSSFQISEDIYKKEIENLRSNKNYQLIYEDDYYLVFKRK